MVKIIFELSEEFIANNASEETIKEKMDAAEGKAALKVLFNSLAFKCLKEKIEEGKTEFVVTPDKLDEKSMTMYNGEIADVCMLAYFSETDKQKSKEENNNNVY